MRVRADVELLIIGAGLAGLALAERLALSSHRRMRVELIEQAPAPAIGRRSWSWYEQGRPRAAFDASWSRWAMSARGMSAGRPFSDGRYGLMRGERIAASALAAIEASPSISLHCGVDVVSMRAVAGGVEVETSGGSLRARQVIDTRPAGADLLARAPWVRTGVRAEVRTGSAVFDTDTALLVHALRKEGAAICFETVLPLAPDHAVVEAVRIAGRHDAARPDFEGALAHLVSGAKADIGLRMRSASPMGLGDHWSIPVGRVRHAASRGAGLALVGAPGRDARRALQWADPAFRALVEGRSPPALQAQSLAARFAGRALLARMAGNPARLMSLAGRVPGDGIVRMAGGGGTFIDAMRLFRALI